MRKLLLCALTLISVISCGPKKQKSANLSLNELSKEALTTLSVPESLKGIKNVVAQLDSAVTAMYGWEPRDSTYNHSVDTLVAGMMNEYNADDPEYLRQDESAPVIDQLTYDKARDSWNSFKQLVDADRYEEALDFYLTGGDNETKKNLGDFLVFLKHSTHRFTFFSEVLKPLMQEYKGNDYAREEYINLLQLEKALEDTSIELQADITGYVPEVYPNVVCDLGIALANSGKMDEAHELFYDLIDGVHGLTGSALLANYMASKYAERLYLIEDDKEGAIANWNRFKEAVEQNKNDFDPEEVEVCLERVESAISVLSKE